MNAPSSSSALDRLLTLATFCVLLIGLLVGLGPNISTVVVQTGESIWPGYAADLKSDRPPPDCDPAELARQRERCEPAAPTPVGEDPFDGEVPFGGDDPFASPKPKPAEDPFAGEDPFAEPQPKPAPKEDPFAGEDPFAEPKPAPKEDPFAGADPFAGEDPFQTESKKPAVNCAALENLEKQCVQQWAHHEDVQARLTPSVQAFRKVERLVSSLTRFEYARHLLSILFILGGLQTTRHRKHIALGEPGSLRSYRIAQGAQLLAFTAWMLSSIADWQVQLASVEPENPALPLLWAGGFALLVATCVYNLAQPPEDLPSTGDGTLSTLASIPLFAWMTLIGAVWFLGAEQHISGQAIFLHRFVKVPEIYIGIGLYIWAGMLLARTSIARRLFDVLTPFELPPNVLAWLVVVLAAFPTAYSGASGIFVIAAGAVIYERLIARGARPRIAMAATAMSGSLGVVLNPCLVVVLIAVLNDEVKSADLFNWGYVVFGLTAALFGIAMLWRNTDPIKAPPAGAFSKAFAAARPLVPFAIIGSVMLLVYRFVLGTPVTEHTAALVLPGVLLALTLFDRTRSDDGPRPWPAITSATGESSHHVGALLFVMAGSVGIGGVVERSEVMELLPETLGGPFPAMAFLVVAMVLVGMTMDALGAVILVSATLKHVALANGIDPLHFWMMVLCAFELGYLTPPVALNHLLARQVIGPDADLSGVPAGSSFERHEHIYVPMLVMGTALVIVAFVPLFFI